MRLRLVTCSGDNDASSLVHYYRMQRASDNAQRHARYIRPSPQLKSFHLITDHISLID